MVRDTFPWRSRPALLEQAARGLKMKAITIALRQAPKLPFASVWGQKLSIFARSNGAGRDGTPAKEATLARKHGGNRRQKKLCHIGAGF